MAKYVQIKCRYDIKHKPDLQQQKPCIAAIIDKALQKDVAKRYQTGAEMAKDIQSCAKQVAKK